MSIFQSSFDSSSDGARYAVPSAEDRVRFANLLHKSEGGLVVHTVRPVDDGTYELQIAGRGADGRYFVDRESLRRLSDGSMRISEVVVADRETASHFGGIALPPHARHRIAQNVAQRRQHLAQIRSETERSEHAPAAAWKHGFDMAMAGVAQPADGSTSFNAGYAAGLDAKAQAGSSVQYGAGALDSAWADITRGSVDASGGKLACPSSLPETTDYAKCTCSQLAKKKKYWQDKEWATPLDSADRKVYGARVHAIAMFEATCDQQSKGCQDKKTTDFSKLDCSCLEQKRRYWVDKAAGQPVLSGKRELYEATANHIASFKETCGQNKKTSSSSSSLGTGSGGLVRPSSGTTSSSGSTSSSGTPSSSSAVSSYPSVPMAVTYPVSTAPMTTVAVPGSSYSAEQYAESSGVSALAALQAYAGGQYALARQHGATAQAWVEQSVAANRPFMVGPKVRCVVDWMNTGIMGIGCLGAPVVGPVGPVARPTYAPMVRPGYAPGVQVSGPIYSRPPSSSARPAVLRPSASSLLRPSIPGLTSPSALSLPGLSRAVSTISRGPSMFAKPGLSSLRPAAMRKTAFRGLDAVDDLFGGLDEDEVEFGGELGELFDEDGV